MAPHDHLLDNFLASTETRSLAVSLLHQVNLKTGPGSGHELGTLKVALPAVCMLLASERLNNTDVSRSSSQAASCVKKKDYDRLYTVAKTILEETEEEKLSYNQLHTNHKSTRFEERMLPYIKRAEKELLVNTDWDHKQDLFKAAVYFWVCSSACLKTLPATPVFSRKYHLSLKKFTEVVEHLNNQCHALRLAIQADFQANLKAALSSPTKPNNPSIPRQSPRKSINFASTSRTTIEESEPLRRSLRNAVAQDSTPKTSPVKRTPQTSPTKIAQPAPFRGFAAVKKLRELPTRDSPKKRASQINPEESEAVGNKGDAMDTGADLDSTQLETPTKRRKLVESLLLEKSRQSIADPIAVPSPSKSIPRNQHQRRQEKALHAMPADSSGLSSDESEPELHLSIRRYRPVYLDHKQWNARDPRLGKIWRKAEKKPKAQVGSEVASFGDGDGDVPMFD